MERQSSRLAGLLSRLVRMVEPVVVSPDTLSNTASVMVSTKLEKYSGRAATKEPMIQVTIISRNACRRFSPGLS